MEELRQSCCYWLAAVPFVRRNRNMGYNMSCRRIDFVMVVVTLRVEFQVWDMQLVRTSTVPVFRTTWRDEINFARLSTPYMTRTNVALQICAKLLFSCLRYPMIQQFRVTVVAQHHVA